MSGVLVYLVAIVAIVAMAVVICATVGLQRRDDRDNAARPSQAAPAGARQQLTMVKVDHLVVNVNVTEGTLRRMLGKSVSGSTVAGPRVLTGESFSALPGRQRRAIESAAGRVASTAPGSVWQGSHSTR